MAVVFVVARSPDLATGGTEGLPESADAPESGDLRSAVSAGSGDPRTVNGDIEEDISRSFFPGESPQVPARDLPGYPWPRPSDVGGGPPTPTRSIRSFTRIGEVYQKIFLFSTIVGLPATPCSIRRQRQAELRGLPGSWRVVRIGPCRLWQAVADPDPRQLGLSGLVPHGSATSTPAIPRPDPSAHELG